MRNYSSEPTSRGDEMADELREWYEAHRESWWERLWRRPDVADTFMYQIMSKVREIDRKVAADCALDDLDRLKEVGSNLRKGDEARAG